MAFSPRAKSASTLSAMAAAPSPCPHTPTIVSADIVANQIKTSLPAAGLFTLTVFNDQNPTPSHRIVQVNRNAGAYTDDFKIATMPLGLYTSIEAALEVNGIICHAYKQYKFQNLGSYLHTQYTLPDEANTTCGSQTSVRVCLTKIVSGSCQYREGFLSSVFDREVWENGAGKSKNYGWIQREWFCTNPPPSLQGIHKYREGLTLADIKPACPNFSLINGQTVAIKPNHPYLSCGTKICIVGLGANNSNIQKTVTDNGGGLVEAQCDNFTTDGRCTNIPSLGNFITIKLF